MNSTQLTNALLANIHQLPQICSSKTHNIRELAVKAERGSYTRIRPGIYADLETAKNHSHAQLLFSAGLAKLGPYDVISHFSAARLWGLPEMSTDPRVFVVRKPGSKPRKSGFKVQLTAANSKDLVEVAGHRITSIERTTLDCALDLQAPHALAIIDSALRLGVTKKQLTAASGRYPKNSAKQLSDLIEIAVADSDSVPESATRFWMIAAGLKDVETQLRVTTTRGNFYLDCGIKSIRLAVEYDGVQKYSDPRALYREKQREDAIRELGWTFVRVTASDLRNPAVLATKFRNVATRLGYKFETNPKK